MKLNLLPTSVAKGSSSMAFPIIAAAVMAIGGVVGALLMSSYSEQMVAAQQKRIEAAKPDAEKAKKIAEAADNVRQQARGLLLNVSLAKAMDEHNSKYTALFDEIRQYIPSYFRVNQMSATPNGADSTTVVLDGTIKTYQQYSDMMLALMRIPGALGVGRSGFQDFFPQVPNLITEDQNGRVLQEWQSARRPDDPYERLELDIAEASNQDFVNRGNFGSLDPNVTRRNAMVGESDVSFTVVLNRNLQVPDPRGTLGQATSLWGQVTVNPIPTTPGGGGAGGNNAPQRPGGNGPARAGGR